MSAWGRKVATLPLSEPPGACARAQTSCSQVQALWVLEHGSPDQGILVTVQGDRQMAAPEEQDHPGWGWSVKDGREQLSREPIRGGETEQKHTLHTKPPAYCQFSQQASSPNINSKIIFLRILKLWLQISELLKASHLCMETWVTDPTGHILMKTVLGIRCL